MNLHVFFIFTMGNNFRDLLLPSLDEKALSKMGSPLNEINLLLEFSPERLVPVVKRCKHLDPIVQNTVSLTSSLRDQPTR